MTDILVVDDDYDIRETVRDVLADHGYSVECAADGEKALAWLRANPPPKLVLLDWMMPVCDGATFRKKQLEDAALAKIPVALLTADAEVGRTSVARGFAAFMQKPVTLDVLLGVVRRFG